MKNLICLVASFFLIVSLLLHSGCDSTVAGDGNLVKETQAVGDFDAISISGAFKVFISQGDTCGLVIETDKNLKQYTSSSVQDKTLFLETRGITFRNPTLNAYITVPNLSQIKVSGASELTGLTPLHAERLTLNTSGTAKLLMDLYCDRLYMDVSGAGKIELTGEVDKMVIEITGAGELNAKQLVSRMLEIKISGAGRALVHTTEEIEARISGAGTIRYLGDPKVYSRITGAGSIYPINQ